MNLVDALSREERQNSTLEASIRSIEQGVHSIESLVADVHAEVRGVARVAANNASRLECIDQRLQQQADALAAALAKARPEVPATFPFDALPRKHLVAAAAAAAALSLLSMRRTRTLLRRMPMSALLLTQLCAGSSLVVFRGLDVLEAMTSSRPASSTSAHRQKRQMLAYALLLLSTAAMPTKGAAHLVSLM